MQHHDPVGDLFHHRKGVADEQHREAQLALKPGEQADGTERDDPRARGANDIVRPRHPDNPLRTALTRTSAYTPDPRWVRPGRLVPFDEPRAVTVGAAVEGLGHVYDSPGQVEFDLDGTAHRLTAFNGKAPRSLMVLFTDATSGVTTYAANRALEIGAPDAEGRVTVDFNRAGNLPCAYTALATCPLPPTENRLPAAIEAGERIPLERGGRP